jgi:hypothetical protein
VADVFGEELDRYFLSSGKKTTNGSYSCGYCIFMSFDMGTIISTDIDTLGGGKIA